MKLCPASITTILFSFLIFWNPILASAKPSNNPAPYYTTDVAINCGYLGNSTAHDGRLWFGDTGSRSVIYMLQPRGQSTNSTADHKCLSADPIPYLTARVSTAEFYYTFKVDPGQKFIRLHFYPSSYRGFEKSQDFFTVEAGPFTLLRNFSPSLAADAIGVKYLVKEFCLNVQEDEYLNLTFSPSHSTKKRNLYAFVNGIEIISMPTSLYYTPEGDVGARVVGQNTRYFIDNSSALETVQRLNIGGNYISPAEDFGMFRRWTEDVNYLLQSNLQPVNYFVDGIKYGNLPAFTVPLKIYYTSWKTGSKYGRADEMHNFTWKIPVDLGFGYLVRLHFCDFSIDVIESERQEFNVLMNNQIAETKANVKRLSGGTGVPMYRDYVVIVKGDKREGKFDFLITLQVVDELVVGLLHGLEIFKLSSLDNNLASPNPVPLRQVSSSWNLKIQNLLLAFGKIKEFIRGMTVLIILLNIIIFKLRQIWEETCHEEKDNLSLSTEQSFHIFSFAEIKSATENFSDALLVGRGGFGNVYKGFICGGSRIVAVKRLRSNSKQGAQEFWTEIETLSKIRHIHLVPLVGYCNEYGEMILVYEYISCGTLAESLYKAERNGMKSTPLTWEQRLRICIGTARALDYLHTGIEHGIIHRDVKDTNILLDENLVAKISDFGLSKLEKITESQYYISTKVKGTPGYLDPDYLITQKLTRKSDIYSFGVVLLVVLCGKPAVDRSIPGETQTLLSSYRECIVKGRIEDIIDPSLRGRISSESLSEFLTSVESCLHHQRKKRSTMAQVVARLECSLERQQTMPSSVSDEAIPVAQPSQVENIQPSQFDQDMVLPIQEESLTVTSPMEEGNISEPIHTSEVKDREDFKSGEEVSTREVFKSGEKDHTFVKKPSWVRPWEALRSRGKTMKKDNLVSASIPQTHRTEGETLQSRHVKNFFSLAEKKVFTGQLRPGSSRSTQKTSRGWPWNRGKHTKKLESVSEANTINLSWKGTQTSNLSSAASTPQIPRSEGVILQFSNLKHFSIAELKNATRNFRPDSKLGEGGFGSVFKGWIDEQTLAPATPGTGMMVAIKRLNRDGTQGHKEWLAELNYLARLCHPNLVKLIGYCLEDEDRLLVYEFMSNGSMDNHLFRRGSHFQSLSANLRIKIVLGAARGLAFLHVTKIIFRDFKTSNILLDKNYNAKLSDFGLAKDGPTGDSTHVTTRIIGTYGYAAPEYIMTGHLTAKSDVYGLGVVLLEVLTGRRTIDNSRPANEHNLVEWAKPYLTNKRRILQILDARLEGQYSLGQAMKLGELAFQCLEMEPKLRPTMDEVVTALEQIQDSKDTTNS